MTGLFITKTKRFARTNGEIQTCQTLSITDGPVDSTRAKASRNVRQLSVMEFSAENTNENEGPMTHGTGAETVAAMAGIVDQLQQVAVGVGAARPSYAVNKVDGIPEDAEV